MEIVKENKQEINQNDRKLCELIMNANPDWNRVMFENNAVGFIAKHKEIQIALVKELYQEESIVSKKMHTKIRIYFKIDVAVITIPELIQYFAKVNTEVAEKEKNKANNKVSELITLFSV